ncbi:TPA: hypothetical protein ACOIVK_002649, partial [Enterococcus faecalis]
NFLKIIKLITYFILNKELYANLTNLKLVNIYNQINSIPVKVLVILNKFFARFCYILYRKISKIQIPLKISALFKFGRDSQSYYVFFVDSS